MSRKPSSLLALDYGPSSLKFVEMSFDGSRVLAAGLMRFSENAWRGEESITTLLRTALAQALGFDGGKVALTVPLCHAFVRQVEIPAAAEDAATALRWDMEQYLARPADLYAIDHQPLEGPGPHGGRLFLSAAYRLSEVERLLRALDAAGSSRPVAFDIDALSTVNAFAYNYPESLGERTVIVQADRHATACYRTLNGEYLDGAVEHEADASLPADPQERAERLLRRANAIADNLRLALRDWPAAERVFLCGELAGDADFRELLKTRMTGGYALLNPFRKLTGPNPENHPNAYPGAPFSAAVGLGLRIAGGR
jgi:Tfp pilus assembly PilM family ATPase